jgi:hypothetical protein
MSVLKGTIRSIRNNGALYLRAEDVAEWMNNSKKLSDDPTVKKFIDSQVSVIKQLPA